MAAMLSSRVSSIARPAASRRSAVRVQASSRPMWYPGATAPKHLNGTMLGDYG